MSYENKGKAITLLADAAYTSGYVAVKKTAVAEQFTVCSAGDVPVGILQGPAPMGTAAAVLIEGISFVKAGGVIAAGASVTTGAGGVAVAATAGDIPFGVAFNAASAEGDIISILLKPVGNPSSNSVIISYTSANLVAGADLTNVVMGVAPFDGTLVAAKVIATGDTAGVDADNTSAFAIKVDSTTYASDTYTAANAFPLSGAVGDLTIVKAGIKADDVFLLSVTNGDTADLPIFIVQLFII